MADEPEKTPEDELLLTEEVEPEGEAVTPPEETDEEEEVFAFGDEPTEPQETDSGLVKHLRSKLKEAQAQLAETKKPAALEKPVEIGPKPTLWDEDVAGDEDLYDQRLLAWHEQNAAEERRKASLNQASEDEKKAWESELTSVNEEKAALARADADDAFATVREALTPAQQALIVQTADKGNRAKLIYALAKNPAQLAELAGINVVDAVSVAKFAKAVTQLEGKLKMVKRRITPAIDAPQRGSAPVSSTAGGAAKQLAKLHAEALESGDYTKYLEYKRKVGK